MLNYYRLSEVTTGIPTSTFFKTSSGDPAINIATILSNMDSALAALVNASSFKDEIILLLLKLYRERSNNYLLGVNLKTASLEFVSSVIDSASLYGTRLQNIDNQIVTLATRSFKEHIKTNVDVDVQDGTEAFSDVTTRVEDAIEEDRLRKVNDGGKTAYNANLTLDTYLSKAERETVNLGARNVLDTLNAAARTRNTSTTADAMLNYTETLREQDPESLNILLGLIRNTYADWMKSLDKLLTNAVFIEH